MEARALTACGPKCMISWALAYFLLYALHTVKTPTSASQIWGTAYSNYLSSPSQQRNFASAQPAIDEHEHPGGEKARSSQHGSRNVLHGYSDGKIRGAPEDVDQQECDHHAQAVLV